jgi:hypothetical protein
VFRVTANHRYESKHEKGEDEYDLSRGKPEFGFCIDVDDEQVQHPIFEKSVFDWSDTERVLTRKG